MKLLSLLLFILIPFFITSQAQLTIGEVFDFEVGDEFHYEMPHAPNNADRITITNKTYSQNLDTVCYERFHSKYLSTFPPVSYSFNTYTDNVCYTNLDSLIIDILFITPDSSYMWYDTVINYDALFCNIEINGYGYADRMFEPIIYNKIWGKSIGIVYNSESMPSEPNGGIFYKTKLFYYKKGTESCGTPDYTSIDDIGKNVLKVYPNPIKNSLTIEVGGMKIEELNIYNAIGKVVYSKSNENIINSINTSSFPVGAYFIEVKSGDYQFVEKVIKTE